MEPRSQRRAPGEGSARIAAADVGPASAADRYATELGARVERRGDDEVVVVLDAKPRHCNDLGVVHGGALFSMADVALSVISNDDATVSVATAASVQFLRAAHAGDRLVACATPSYRGGRLGAFLIRITSGGELVALMTAQTLRRGMR